MDMTLASGPFRDLNKAREDAYNSVDPPHTLWAVIELFGPGFDRKVGDETWGELWVVPDDLAAELAEAKGATSHQVVDSYGYEPEVS